MSRQWPATSRLWPCGRPGTRWTRFLAGMPGSGSSLACALDACCRRPGSTRSLTHPLCWDSPGWPKQSTKSMAKDTSGFNLGVLVYCQEIL